MAKWGLYQFFSALLGAISLNLAITCEHSPPRAT